ncbi:hypothetical protein [Modestobacter lapidis]|nr:hypothetical protein [Modestobacter lapidis]
MASPLTLRSAGLATAAALLVLPLAACSFSSDNVSCANNECTVTLTGSGAEAEILGTSLAFGGVQDGRATLSVGNASVSCAEGESVSAGPLSLTCTTVTDDSVALTAGLS